MRAHRQAKSRRRRAHDQFAYWAERLTPGSLRRMRLSGGAIEVLREEASLFSWDLAGDGIYFTQDAHTAISVMSTSGGRERIVITPSAPIATATPRPVLVHDDHVYWVQQGGSSQLYRSPLDSMKEELIAEEPEFSGIEFDGGQVYWTVPMPPSVCPPMGGFCRTPGAVRSKSLAGGERQTIVRDDDGAAALAFDAERVYWTTSTGIRSARKDGSDVKTVASGLIDPIAIAVDDQAVYWASYAQDATIGRANK